MEVHLLPVFDTFTFPSAIVSFKLGDLARLEKARLLAARASSPARLIGPCQV
jgi:hypothetical protein